MSCGNIVVFTRNEREFALKLLLVRRVTLRNQQQTIGLPVVSVSEPSPAYRAANR